MYVSLNVCVRSFGGHALLHVNCVWKFPEKGVFLGVVELFVVHLPCVAVSTQLTP